MKAEEEAKEVYDYVAEYYHEHRTKTNPEGWFYNELLEMPATLELIGKVKGKKLLDFGCGTGIYAKLLTKKGGEIKGFDISPAMLKIAKELNPKLDLRLASGNNIPFKEKFDIVYAPLVLDYFDNWDIPFNQVKKVLKQGGEFIFSIGNPVAEMVKKIQVGNVRYKVLGINDYFKEGKIYGTWRGMGGKDIQVPSYHKTYETIIKIILRNGFEIVGYKDTFPLKKAKKLFPEDYAVFSKQPYFCVWKVRLK